MLPRVSWSDRLLMGGRRNMLDLKEAPSLLFAIGPALVSHR